ncbi:uncharacterized protein LOC100679439 [Nasonia vitripennis]|uniref:HAUS augmin-like complex subunit 3 N-terminal domain-containing protein n=1 Tax=Nasonia vitripennis TaxID=7425 RepID=A0A7M7GIC5_NASVI|nr:uncharacterized protein LOC100679439 [Nasonia vitripennis]
MNKICGSTFHSKLQELLPSLPSSITPEVLEKLCKDDAIQPFLKWFYANITSDNVLTDGCIQLKKHIEKNDTWLHGRELELALAEATHECPELLKLVESDYWSNNQLVTDLANEKELYDPDLEYLKSIEESIQNLKDCEEQLDNKLDKEAELLKKEEIKVKLLYDSCSSVLEDFDNCHRQFFKAIELLASTYINAVQKKGESCLWTQMPIELYIKQLETYNDYLNSYAKRQFSMSQKDGNEDLAAHTSFLSDSNENEKLGELISCQKNLFTSKMHEIIAKAEDEASKSLMNYVIEIYNSGNLKAPRTPVLTRAEVAELTKSRDFLEENVNLLQERPLVDLIEQFSKSKIVKVLEEEAESRLQRRRSRLLRLERLCTLAKEHGHAFSTLLCMLFELQIHRINEIVQFVIDARHYLSMEFSLSSTRNDSIQKLQNEYSSILASSKDQNAFCRTFIEMTELEESNDNFQSSVWYYDELKDDNSIKLKTLLDDKLADVIESSKKLEAKVMDLYNSEITSGPTLSFKAVPCNVQDEIDKTVKQIEGIETNVESIRNKLRNMIKETSSSSFEREKLLMWQKFLANPESLKDRCKELEDLRDRTTF